MESTDSSPAILTPYFKNCYNSEPDRTTLSISHLCILNGCNVYHAFIGRSDLHLNLESTWTSTLSPEEVPCRRAYASVRGMEGMTAGKRWCSDIRPGSTPTGQWEGPWLTHADTRPFLSSVALTPSLLIHRPAI